MLGRWFHNRRAHRPQKFACELRVTLKNTSKQTEKCDLIIPKIVDTPHQKLLGPVTFSPSAMQGREERFGNMFAGWELVLKPGQEKVFFEKFSIQVLPQHHKNLKNFSVADYENPDQKFLKGNAFLSPQDPRLLPIVQGLLERSTEVMNIAAEANTYVMQKLTYGDPIEGLYSLDQSLSREKVDCGGFDVLLGSILQACGIPVRVVSGFFAGFKSNTMHAWLEFQLPDGQWLAADPSTEQLRNLHRTKKSGALNFVGSDRIVFSHGCDLELHFQNQKIVTDILQNPIVSPASQNILVHTVFLTKAL